MCLNFDLCRQKKLQSLMSGNNLQSLEEEVSKEEDESMIIKINSMQDLDLGNASSN